MTFRAGCTAVFTAHVDPRRLVSPIAPLSNRPVYRRSFNFLFSNRLFKEAVYSFSFKSVFGGLERKADLNNVIGRRKKKNSLRRPEFLKDPSGFDPSESALRLFRILPECFRENGRPSASGP